MFSLSQSAVAQPVTSTICDTDDSTTFSSTIPYPESATNIYIRAGRTEDEVQGGLYYQLVSDDTATDCVLYEATQLSADTWQAVGHMPQSSGAPSIRLVLKLDRSSDSLAGASAPMLLLAEDSPPCQIVTDCVVSYAGDNFTIFPRTLSYSTDSLQVAQLINPTDDQVQKVLYSVDGKQVYATEGLEAFNMGFVGIGKHTVGRTVVFESGQSLYDSQAVENDFSLKQLFSAWYYRNRNIVLVFTGAIGLLLVSQLGLWLIRSLRHRKQWRRNHGLAPTDGTSGKAGRQSGVRPNAEFEVSIFDLVGRHKRIALGVIVGCVLLIMANAFVVTRFTVQGVSMEPTLLDGTDRAVLLLPAKVANFTGSAYVPARGAIVVLKRPEVATLDIVPIDSQSYVVKRVIGLPNERIVITGGVITVYNADNPDGFVPDDSFSWTPNVQGSEGLRIDVTLRDNELFVVGDNRSQSVDSRYYGPVKSTEIVGRVIR